jgi:hypothetical protein
MPSSVPLAGNRSRLPFSNPTHDPAMFWTFDRLQLFVWAAKIRNKCACAESIETSLPTIGSSRRKERVEREARRVRVWCERKDAMWDAMLAENAESRATWKSTGWPWR